jgi:hypothetical protein
VPSSEPAMRAVKPGTGNYFPASVAARRRPASPRLSGSRARARGDNARFFLTYLFTSTVVTGAYLATHASGDSLTPALAMQPVLATLALVGRNSYSRTTGYRFDLSRPAGLYGMFYAVYYLVPFVALDWRGGLPVEHVIYIGALYMAGYLAVLAGEWFVMRKSRAAGADAQLSIQLPRGGAPVMLVMCGISMGLVAYHYIWLNEQGQFFTHATTFQEAATIPASIQEFIADLTLPVIILLAVLASQHHANVSTIARRLFWGFGAATVVLDVLGSQTRPAVTVMVFMVTGAALFRQVRVAGLHMIAFCIAAVSLAAFIQGVRVASANQYAVVGNQFAYAVTNAVPDALSGLQGGSSSAAANSALDRSSNGSIYLSDIMDATQGGRYLYGSGMAAYLPTLVPRVVWLDKPAVDNPNLTDRRLLGLPRIDGALTPLNSFYAEAGPLGVVLGSVVIGCLLGLATRIGFRTRDAAGLVLLAFVWAATVQMESEAVFTLLATLRSAVVFYVAYTIARVGWGHVASRGRAAAR